MSTFSPTPRMSNWVAPRISWIMVALMLSALAVVIGLAVTTNALVVVILVLLGILLALAGKSQDGGFIGLLAVSFLLPFAVVPLDIGLKPSFLNLAVLMIYGRWLIRWIRSGELHPIPIYTLGMVTIFGLLVGAATLWGLNFASPSLFELRKVGEYLLNLGLFILALQLIRSPSQIRLIVKSLAVLGVVGAILGLIFYFIPQETARTWLGSLSALEYPAASVALRYIHSDPRESLRAIGVAVDPNLLGATSVLGGCALLPFVFGSRRLEVRLSAGVGLLILAIAIFFTYSRNALVALCGVTALLAVVRYRALVPLGLLGLFLLLFLPQTQAYAQRLMEGLLRQDQATLMRLAEYGNAALIIETYPWTGLGFFGSPSLDFAEGISSMVLLTVATTMGIPAMLLFFWIWVRNLLHFVQIRRTLRDHPMEPYALALVGAVVALGLTGLFDHFYVNLLYPHMSALYWVLLATCTRALCLLAESNTLQPTIFPLEEA